MKQIPLFPEYEVSEDGLKVCRNKALYAKVRRAEVSQGFQPVRGKSYPNGYLYVTLLSKKENGIIVPGVYRVPVHRLVAMAYLGDQPEGKPWINHKDGNKLHNHANNLEWTSISDNIKHSYEVLGRQSTKPMLGKKVSLQAKLKMRAAKEGKLHPQYKGIYVIYGRKYYSANAAAKDLQLVTMTILRKCKSGKDKDFVFVPDPEKIL